MLTLSKSLIPTSDPGRFDLSVGGSIVKSAAMDSQSGTATVNVGDSVSVSEAVNSGSSPLTLNDYVSTLACNSSLIPSPNNNTSGSVTVPLLAANTTITCTITNTRKGSAKVIKTLGGLALSPTDSFTFQLRQGASPTDPGTILETGMATGTTLTSNTINFVAKLLPTCADFTRIAFVRPRA